MAEQDYTEAAGADIELAQLATALIDEHNEQARAELVSKLIRTAHRAAKDSIGESKPDRKVAVPEWFNGFNFSAGGGSLYSLSKDAEKSEVINQLNARLSQLEAMLITISGAGAESFQQWNETIQDNYLWACNSIATECRELAELV